MDLKKFKKRRRPKPDRLSRPDPGVKPLDKFVIFSEGREEFLCESQRQTGVEMLGWCKYPFRAIKYDKFKTAKREAQRIATDKGRELVICQLYESKTQMATSVEDRVSPSTDPSRN